MKVRIGTTYLARGVDAGEDVSGLRSQGRSQAQVNPAVGAEAVECIDRGNLQMTITFSVDREHESIEAAIVHALRHKSDLIGISGDCEFVSEDGVAERVLTLAAAVIPDVDVETDGVSTTTRYTITGGKVT
jgi:hypothetical protein